MLQHKTMCMDHGEIFIWLRVGFYIKLYSVGPALILYFKMYYVCHFICSKIFCNTSSLSVLHTRWSRTYYRIQCCFSILNSTIISHWHMNCILLYHAILLLTTLCYTMSFDVMLCYIMQSSVLLKFINMWAPGILWIAVIHCSERSCYAVQYIYILQFPFLWKRFLHSVVKLYCYEQLCYV